MVEQRVIRRYSTAFKLKVVSEIEAGKLNKHQARVLYGIAGGATIQHWIRSFGKDHLIHKMVTIQMTDEISKLKQLEKEKRHLESALAQAHLKILTLEATVEVLEEKAGTSVKKKTDAASSKSFFNGKPPETNGTR